MGSGELMDVKQGFLCNLRIKHFLRSNYSGGWNEVRIDCENYHLDRSIISFSFNQINSLSLLLPWEI